MNLENKVSLVVGGARIGIVVAEELAQAGSHVAVTYRTSKRAATVVEKKVRQKNRKGLVLKGDMTNAKEVKRVINQVKKKFGRLDVLVNMASVYKETPFDDLAMEEWDESVSANLKSAHLTVFYARSLLRKRGGRVINFADWIVASGRPRYKKYLPYYTSKMGLLGLTQAQALELAPQVLVNAIAPGPILPPANMSGKEINAVKKEVPLHRWGGSTEIAKAVLFLCHSDFITGECIRVDGGRHIH